MQLTAVQQLAAAFQFQSMLNINALLQSQLLQMQQPSVITSQTQRGHGILPETEMTEDEQPLDLTLRLPSEFSRLIAPDTHLKRASSDTTETDKSILSFKKYT